MRLRVRGSNTVRECEGGMEQHGRECEGECTREQHSERVLGSKMGRKTAEDECKERV